MFMDPAIGDQVQLRGPLPYLKTADPMPMLRPPELISPDEIGEMVALRSGGTAVVRFRRGKFLISIKVLKLLDPAEPGRQDAFAALPDDSNRDS